jgi:TRAP-type C4-dicarboxylate transport system permease small subunit
VSAAQLKDGDVAHGEAFVPVPGPFRSLAGAALAISCCALVALAIVEVWQVVTRYVLDSPAAWTEAVALLLIKIALMLAAAVGVRQETHFRFALGAEAAGRWRSGLEAFGRLVTAAIGIVLAGWGTSLMLATWELKAPGAPLPVGLNFVPFVAGGVLITLFAVERLYRSRRS